MVHDRFCIFKKDKFCVTPGLRALGRDCIIIIVCMCSEAN